MGACYKMGLGQSRVFVGSRFHLCPSAGSKVDFVEFTARLHLFGVKLHYFVKALDHGSVVSSRRCLLAASVSPFSDIAWTLQVNEPW